MEIRNLILHIRGKAVMLDSDLAVLYRVETRVLNQAVQRNLERFPEDFMFQLKPTERTILKSQFVTSRWGGKRKLPYVFTEQGVAMLSSVLRSDTAIKINVQIMRAFVQIRRLGLSVVDLKRKIEKMESKYDHQFKIVFDALRNLFKLEPANKRPMGFIRNKNE